MNKGNWVFEEFSLTAILFYFSQCTTSELKNGNIGLLQTFRKGTIYLLIGLSNIYDDCFICDAVED